MTSNQTCHLKTIKMHVTAEKPNRMLTCLKQKQVLGYHGQVVQCKIKSFRKLPNVKGESPATTKDYPLPCLKPQRLSLCLDTKSVFETFLTEVEVWASAALVFWSSGRTPVSVSGFFFFKLIMPHLTFTLWKQNKKHLHIEMCVFLPVNAV